jgi:hypothetical protein
VTPQQNAGPSNLLPEELDRALPRATDRTLAALTALRRAVRDHVHTERDGGATMQQIELELRDLISFAHEKAARTEGADGDQYALAAQMMKWTEGFFNQND